MVRFFSSGQFMAAFLRKIASALSFSFSFFVVALSLACLVGRASYHLKASVAPSWLFCEGSEKVEETNVIEVKSRK